METWGDHPPAVPVEVQLGETGAAGDQLSRGAGHGALDRPVVVSRPVLFIELLAQRLGALAGSGAEALPEAVEGLDQDLGVAMAAQLSGDVPVVIVLAPPG